MRVVREGLGGSRGTGQIGRVYVWVEGVHEWACARVCAKSVWRRRFVGARERVPERLWLEPVLPLIHVGRVWVCGLTRREKVAAIMGLASMAASIELSCSCWKAFASIAVRRRSKRRRRVSCFVRFNRQVRSRVLRCFDGLSSSNWSAS